MDLAVFHDLEQGGYQADVAFWEEQAANATRTLELGAGTGRLSVRLAPLTDLTAVDYDPVLVRALQRRARKTRPPARVVCADALALEIGGAFDLVIAAVNFVQIIGGAPERSQLLQGVAAHLAPAGRAVFAITEIGDLDDAQAVRRHVGRRVYISRQQATYSTEWGTELTWTRRVHTRGGRTQRLPPLVVHYDDLTVEQLEAEAAEHGLRLLDVAYDHPVGFPPCDYVSFAHA